MHVYQGLAVIQGAKLAGAGKIIAVDINPGTFAQGYYYCRFTLRVLTLVPNRKINLIWRRSWERQIASTVLNWTCLSSSILQGVSQNGALIFPSIARETPTSCEPH